MLLDAFSYRWCLLRFVFVGGELQLVGHEFAAFVEKHSDVVEAVERDDALLNIENFELFVHISTSELT